MELYCPPNYKIAVSANPLNQFQQPGVYAPPLLWSVPSQFGAFVENPDYPGEDKARIFVATTDSGMAGQSTVFSVTAQTVNGPVVEEGSLHLSFPQAPVDHIVVTAGVPVPA